MSSHSDRVVDVLARLLTRRERDHAPTRAARVLGRNEDGTERLQRTDATCVTRGAVSSNFAGQVILESAISPFHRLGSIDIAPVSQQASADTLWIDRLDPAELRPGESYTITVTGRGFTPGVVIEFLEPAPLFVQPTVLNGDVTIESLTVEDDSTIALNVTVAPGARLFPYGAPIAFGRPS